MRICKDCNAVFESPLAIKSGFDHAFGHEVEWEYVCPFCGSPEFTDAIPCENCNTGWLQDGEHLCIRCRAALARKVRAFADRLTEGEELQFDEWMDGMSITDRKNWR